MAASNTSLTPSNSTDALFRLWGAAIKAALTAAGWTQTADTGQINWATVTAPVATNTAAGYEIWKMADGLTLWYLKIEYGSGGTVTYPAIWITVGTGSNGGGTLTGQLSARFQLAAAAQSATTPGSCAFAGGTSWFGMSLWYDQSANQTVTLMIGRIRDTAGDEADTGVVVFGSSSAAHYHQVVPLTGSILALNTTTISPFWPMMTPPSGLTTSLVGTTVGVYTLHPFAQVHFPSILGGIAYFSGAPDISAYATFVVERYGVNHTYLALGTFTPCGTGMALAMRYE
jgi:hypothetical protein